MPPRVCFEGGGGDRQTDKWVDRQTERRRRRRRRRRKKDRCEDGCRKSSSSVQREDGMKKKRNSWRKDVNKTWLHGEGEEEDTTNGCVSVLVSVCVCVCVCVCVSSTAHIRDVAPDVDREEEEEEGDSLRTLTEGAFDFNMFNDVIWKREAARLSHLRWVDQVLKKNLSAGTKWTKCFIQRSSTTFRSMALPAFSPIIKEIKLPPQVVGMSKNDSESGIYDQF